GRSSEVLHKFSVRSNIITSSVAHISRLRPAWQHIGLHIYIFYKWCIGLKEEDYFQYQHVSRKHRRRHQMPDDPNWRKLEDRLTRTPQ
ncbi:unnamed protein product, partial [Cylicocyclus nassatus]